MIDKRAEGMIAALDHELPAAAVALDRLPIVEDLVARFHHEQIAFGPRDPRPRIITSPRRLHNERNVMDAEPSSVPIVPSRALRREVGTSSTSAAASHS